MVAHLLFPSLRAKHPLKLHFPLLLLLLWAWMMLTWSRLIFYINKFYLFNWKNYIVPDQLGPLLVNPLFLWLDDISFMHSFVLFYVCVVAADGWKTRWEEESGREFCWVKQRLKERIQQQWGREKAKTMIELVEMMFFFASDATPSHSFRMHRTFWNGFYASIAFHGSFPRIPLQLTVHSQANDRSFSYFLWISIS